jgi:hypothetical protein
MLDTKIVDVFKERVTGSVDGGGLRLTSAALDWRLLTHG